MEDLEFGIDMKEASLVFSLARKEAMEKMGYVVESHEGAIWRIYKDGKREKIKDIEPDIKVRRNNVKFR